MLQNTLPVFLKTTKVIKTDWETVTDERRMGKQDHYIMWFPGMTPGTERGH